MTIRKRIATLAVALIATVSLHGRVVGQTQPPEVKKTQTSEETKKPQTSEVEQLKLRLQQLEDTVRELKGQISAIEETKTNPTPQVVDALYTDPAPPDPARKPQDPKGESTFEIYGFAMLDAGYQFKQNDPDWFDVVRPVKLPSFPNEFAPNGNTYFGVRQSRLGVKSSTPTKYGELKTQFEFELFGTGAQAGQTIFRLRHAYGELGQFGVGQQNSTFMDGDVFPNTIEYWGPNGMVLFRNVQFRWMPLKGRNAVTIAVERPGASADQGRFADRIELQGVRPHFNLPDLTANVRWTRGWGHFQVAGLLKRMAWIDTLDDEFDLGGSAVGAGLNLTSVLKFGEHDTGKFAFVFGQGIQNYMNDADVDVGIETNLAAGDPRRPIVGKALPMWSFIAYLDHYWNKRFSSSFGYSMMDVDNSDGQAPDAYHRGHYASGNLLYYPWENVLMGGEFIWGRRENFLDGFKADDFRIQFSFKYNFSKSFSF
ncbi:MAG TPA: DcaP family trimeric outer membrane transporter [Pyrinomonadaceae bacterium]|nr:DcaP family trimeric outer membrane transporter [Pyrinomonadaceae bacterium]